MKDFEKDFEQDFEQAVGDIESAFVEVGGDMSAAIYEIAIELGGEDFATEVITAAGSAPGLPNPLALQMIQDREPGSAERVMERAKELAEQKSLKSSKHGSTILRGFALLGGGLASIGEGMSYISLSPKVNRGHNESR